MNVKDMQEFKFDYDKQNDDLFLYTERSKSTASIEIGDLVLDFDRNMGLSAIEIMNATKFLKSFISDDRITVNREALAGLVSCMVDTKMQDNFLLIKLILSMKQYKKVPINVFVPRITKSSPSISAL